MAISLLVMTCFERLETTCRKSPHQCYTSTISGVSSQLVKCAGSLQPTNHMLRDASNSMTSMEVLVMGVFLSWGVLLHVVLCAILLCVDVGTMLLWTHFILSLFYSIYVA